MEYCNVLLYKPMASCAGRANIKNGTGPVKGPRRRDIAPTGELAGLPARDAPKSSRVTASLESGPGLQKSSKKSLLFSGAVSNRIRAGFTRPHTQRLFQFEYPNFSIACFSRPRHVANRLQHLLSDGIVHRQLDLGLGQEFDPVFGASIKFRV